MLNFIVAAMIAAHTPTALVPTASAALPPLRVEVAGLDLNRPSDARILAARIEDASLRYCDVHIRTLTPDRVGDPTLCRRAVADLLVGRLDRAQWRAFASSGGLRALRRP